MDDRIYFNASTLADHAMADPVRRAVQYDQDDAIDIGNPLQETLQSVYATAGGASRPSAEILGCLRLNGFIFRLVHHARDDIDPSKMVVDSFDAGHIFRGGDEGLALACFGNRAPKIDHTVTHHDVD